MQAFCCPRCGSLSYPGLMGFPRCHKCHEQLRQCRYCSHQHGGICRLEAEPAPSLEEEDGRPFCTSFASALGVEPTAGVWRRPLTDRARTVAYLVLAAACLLLFRAIALHQELLPPQIDPDAASIPVLDGRAVAGFTITGDHSRHPSFELQIDSEILRGYTFLEAEPPGVRTAGGELPTLTYNLPKEDRLRVQLCFFAKRQPPGHLPLKVKVIADGEVASQAQTTLVCPTGTLVPSKEIKR